MNEEELKREAFRKEASHKAKKEKEALEALKPKQKFYYDVKVECLLPATLTYRILAEDPHQALSFIKGKSPSSVQHRLIGRKELKATVYDAGSSMIRFIKHLVGL